MDLSYYSESVISTVEICILRDPAYIPGIQKSGTPQSSEKNFRSKRTRSLGLMSQRVGCSTVSWKSMESMEFQRRSMAARQPNSIGCP